MHKGLRRLYHDSASQSKLASKDNDPVSIRCNGKVALTDEKSMLNMLGTTG